MSYLTQLGYFKIFTPMEGKLYCNPLQRDCSLLNNFVLEVTCPIIITETHVLCNMSLSIIPWTMYMLNSLLIFPLNIFPTKQALF
jgi:hypothetical protein